MSRLRCGSFSWACSAGLALALLALALVPSVARAATDDENLTGLVYLASGAPLSSTPWADTTPFAVWVAHGGNWSAAWRYPPSPSWYTTSGGAYSLVLPAAQKDVRWSNGDPYRVEFDASAIFGSPLVQNATSHGTGDPGEFSPVGSVDNVLVWTSTDNWQRWDVVILTLPDLSISPSELTVTPSAPLEDAVVRVNATVRNLGNRDAADVAVRFTDGAPPSGTPIGPDSVVPLIPPAGFAYVEVAWTARPAGSHRLCASADPDHRIVESDEGNNVACVDVTVTPGPVTRPDYVPYRPQPLPPLRAGLARRVPLSVEVRNQGNTSAATAATVAFFNETTPAAPFATFSVSPLAPAQASSPFNATWTSPSTPGTYGVEVDVDYGNNLAEWNETNNRFAWTIQVVTGPVTSLVLGAPNVTAALTYVTSTTSLSFSVLDQGGAGIRNTTYRIDNGTWVNYTATGSFTLATEGPHYLEWRSEDRAGNVEGMNARVLWVDDTPPTTTLLPAAGPYAVDTVFTLNATDAGSGVAATQFRVDGGAWTTYTGGFTLGAGDHVIGYRSVDRLINTEAEKTRNVTVGAPPDWKPLVALVFSLFLALAGAWSSRRAPWKGGKGMQAALIAFALTALPFVVLEAATGVASLFTNMLSIPPVLGVGTAVDSTILAVGLAVAIYRAAKARAPDI